MLKLWVFLIGLAEDSQWLWHTQFSKLFEDMECAVLPIIKCTFNPLTAELLILICVKLTRSTTSSG